MASVVRIAWHAWPSGPDGRRCAKNVAVGSPWHWLCHTRLWDALRGCIDGRLDLRESLRPPVPSTKRVFGTTTERHLNARIIVTRP